MPIATGPATAIPAPLEPPRGSARRPRECLICEERLGDYVAIPAKMVNEFFYTPELRRRVPSLEFGRCGRCGSVWAVDERCDRQLLLDIYAALPDEYWTDPGDDERLYRSVESALTRHARGNVIYDVGCGDGRLLRALSEGWEKHGLEPGHRAVAICRADGLDTVVGTPATRALRNVCDALTCVDVLEHTFDPATELTAMADMLRPGGVLVLLTGDAGSWTARLAGGFWEYLYCVGHISVLSRCGLRRLLPRCGFDVLEHSTMNHSYSTSLPVWLWQLRQNRRRYRQGRGIRRMKYCLDHQFVVARKTDHEQRSDV